MTGLRLIIALVMMMGSLPVLASHGASFHTPKILQAIEAARHASLADVATDDDHVHDDGMAQERQSGHAHGHDPADHTHETMSLAVVIVAFGWTKDSTWEGGPPPTVHGEPCFLLDRPPRTDLAT